MRVLVTGATGLMGKRLVAALRDRGDVVVALVRDPVSARAKLAGGVEVHRWASTDAVPREAVQGVDVVFNLAGDPLADGRWTTEKKARIVESRVTGTRNLVAAFAEGSTPSVLVSASGISVYGDRGDDWVDEEASPGTGFLEDLSVAWEHQANVARERGVRVVTARFGIVLAKGGGALGAMELPFRAGLGGKLGSGKQWWSWVHIDDAIGLLLHAAADPSVSGPMNVVAPEPVTNAAFTRAYGRAIHRPTIFPVPELALRVAFGEKSVVLLSSQRARPAVAERSGYAFRHPRIDEAMAAVQA